MKEIFWKKKKYGILEKINAILSKMRYRGKTMKFRPCIDIHNGAVKQIVGGSLTDQGDAASENFVAKQDAAFFAQLYKEKKLEGGHVILLNPSSSEYYGKTRAQAIEALNTYRGGLQVGGGIDPFNAEAFLKAGASHVIVTSYVFKDGQFRKDRLKEMILAAGREHLVLDLSCRKREGAYFIVTDRWQKYTEVKLDEDTIQELSESCGEFLVHAVDVEGKAQGIEEELAAMLGSACHIPTTYAGGVHDFEDLRKLKELGKGRIDVTIGSALDLFGGSMKFEDVLSYIKK